MLIPKGPAAAVPVLQPPSHTVDLNTHACMCFEEPYEIAEYKVADKELVSSSQKAFPNKFPDYFFQSCNPVPDRKQILKIFSGHAICFLQDYFLGSILKNRIT